MTHFQEYLLNNGMTKYYDAVHNMISQVEATVSEQIAPETRLRFRTQFLWIELAVQFANHPYEGGALVQEPIK
jgi:hypothetical protein